MYNLSKFFKKENVDKLLDFYCGTGRNSIFLAQKGFDVYCFDRSKTAIASLRKRQKETNRKMHIRLLKLTGELPYRNNFFDAVIIVRALYQARLAGIKKYIKEIHRITKNGGYVYVESDQQYVWKRKQFYGQVKTNEKGTYQHGKGGDYYHYFTKKEFKSLFRDYNTIKFHFKDRKFNVLLQKKL